MPSKASTRSRYEKMPPKLRLKLANECEDMSKRIKLNSSQKNYHFYILTSKQMDERYYGKMMELFEDLMREMYEKSSWGWKEEEKMAEWKHPRTRILLVFQRPLSDPMNNVKFNELPPEGADDYNDLVAFMCFRYEVGADKSECALYVYELHVHRDFQRQGIGDEMMRMAKVFGSEFKMDKIMLTSFRCNEVALKFYNKLNFATDKSSPARNEADYVILSSKFKYLS